ncbi:uncharacterized protein LOC111711131 [Eurytemora carolleeae]|uniref:uncharacterized protein LOC111711131 n=1 Tax=Eurytemora carolleeae TaxID=1294199 RepID=UPI000C793CA2|nr:uncharacterized protein LOC111711131 [Eurytemora carolleeae]|eukprot:XP_023341157.1 uncharacterized protein LOC111711131 [Eurytemora affinis]
MVLFVDGEAKSDSTFLDFDKLTKLHQISSKFAGENARELFPRDKYLYVGEHEMVAVTQDDLNIEFIGSEDATTCHIIILREKNLLSCGVVHIGTQNMKFYSQNSAF